MGNQKFMNKKLDDNDYVFTFQKRMNQFNRIHDILFEKTNDKCILDGEGDLCSPMVIVLKDKSQDCILDLYKSALENYKLDLNNVRVTYLNKCSNMNLNLSAFKTEVEEIGDTAHYILHDFDCPFCKNKSLVDYKKFVRANDNDIKEEEKHKLLTELWGIIGKAFGFLLENVKLYR